MGKVVRAESKEQLLHCYRVVAELRPHVAQDEFLRRVRRQAAQGYQIVYLEVGQEAVAFAGYRIQDMLYQRPTGRMMYVDDLATSTTHQSKGRGQELFAWLVKEAKKQGCDALELDSGVQRVAAHRFYLGVGMHISSYHFRLPLASPVPRVLFAVPPPAQKRAPRPRN
jgi:GNAT superfamily N-acetyltransferase